MASTSGRQQASEREAHLVQMPLAIRKINQLITDGTDSARLIEQSCEILTEVLGYDLPWIVLAEQFVQCEFPHCMQQALAQDMVVVVENPDTECAGCPLTDVCANQSRMICRMERGGWIYGVVSICVPSFRGSDAEEQELFRELAGDLAFGLNRIGKDRDLLRNRELLAAAEHIAHWVGWELDLQTGKLVWSDETYRIFGFEPRQFPATYSAFLEAVHPDDRATVDTAYSDSLRDKRDGYEIVHRVVHRTTGKIRYVHVRCRHLKDDDGHIIRSIGWVQDITERRQLERHSAEEKALARVTEKLLGAGSFEEISLLVLDTARQLTGSSFGFAGYLDPQTGHFVSDTMTRDIWDACQVADKTVIFEKFSGLWGWVLSNCRPLLSNNPKNDHRASGIPEGHIPIHRFLGVPVLYNQELIGMIALANSQLDYTDQDLAVIQRLSQIYSLRINEKRVQDALRKRERHLTYLNTVSPAIVYSLDATDSSPTWVSSNVTSIMGYTLDEVLQPGWWAGHLHPEDRDQALAMSALVFDTERSLHEYRFQRKDGEFVWILDDLRLLRDDQGKTVGLVGSWLDITERKQADEVVNQIEEKIQSILDNLSDVIWSLSWPNFDVLFISPSVEIVYERPLQDFYDDPLIWQKAVHPDDKHLTDNALAQLLNNGTAEHEYRIVTPGGIVKWIHDKSKIIYDESNNPVRVDGIVTDITNRKCAEEELQRSEELWRITLSNVTDTVILTDAQGRITFVCPNVHFIFGYSDSEVMALGHIERLLDDLEYDPGELERYDVINNLYCEITDKHGNHHDGLVGVKNVDFQGHKLLFTVHEATKLLNVNKLNRILQCLANLRKQFILEPDPFKLFPQFLEELLSITKSEFGLVGDVLSDNGNPYVKMYALTNLAWDAETTKLYNDFSQKGYELRKLDNLVGLVVTSGKPVISNDPATDPRGAVFPKGHPRIMSFIGIPIIYGDKLVGVVGLANRPGGYDQKSLDCISPVIAGLGQIIVARWESEARENAEAKLLELATTDSLTGAINRRGFNTHLGAIIASNSRYPEETALLMLDIDHFKSVNDTYGHDAGDQVLIKLVQQLQSIIRKVDILARWGGEEFIILMPKTNKEKAVILAERIRQHIEDYEFDHPQYITISLGLTSLEKYDTLESIVKRADDALYQAKQSGRNRVIAL
ncbi:PAS domain-containing protein [Desulfogranum marinum]|uniref:PAS domain-containing protein n=1 Tax=Desulfogranum marinum TaxID=453220 RepID=UPI0019657D1C|nr:PAS domain-containing protein [Desulfogranum marinum]MBM9514889.1 PAS domain-containing protein [Desulfogranum marinum]